LIGFEQCHNNKNAKYFFFCLFTSKSNLKIILNVVSNLTKSIYLKVVTNQLITTLSRILSWNLGSSANLLQLQMLHSVAMQMTDSQKTEKSENPTFFCQVVKCLGFIMASQSCFEA
jgi:hypothetical protein